MNSDTPAALLKKRDWLANVAAFRECISRLSRESLEVRYVSDIRYGLGGWARELVRRYPEAEIRGWETDWDTVRRAFRSDRINLELAPFPSGDLPGRTDLLLADFNTATSLRLEPLTEAISLLRPLAVIYTDVACSKLHMNYRSYGLESRRLADYYAATRIEGYRLLGWSKQQRNASTSVWVRRVS